MKKSFKSTNIKGSGKKTSQEKNRQAKKQQLKTSKSPYKKQKLPIKKPQKKVPVSKQIQANKQNYSTQESTHDNSKKSAYDIFLSNIKTLNKQKNNRTENSAKKRNKFSSVNSQYKHELKQSNSMIEIMLQKIANLKGQQIKQNKQNKPTTLINSSIYQKTASPKKKTNKRNNQISVNSKTMNKQKNNNLYNLYNENAKKLSTDVKIENKPKMSTERKRRNKRDTIFSYNEGKKDDILKKGISVTYENYDYDKLLEFDSVKKDKKLKDELNKLISENKKLKRVGSCPDNLYLNTVKDEKNLKEIKGKLEMQKNDNEQKIFNEKRKKTILRRYIKKKEKDINNILRIKFLEFYYKSKVESIIIVNKIDKSSGLTSQNKDSNENKNNLCNSQLSQNNTESTSNNNLNNVGSNLNVTNNVTNDNIKIQETNNNQNNIVSDIPNNCNTSSIPNSTPGNNQNDNSPIINQTSTTQNKEINNNENNNTMQTVVKQEKSVTINEAPKTENNTIPQVISSNKNANNSEMTQKEMILQKSRKLRKLLSEKEKERKDTLKKYFNKFLLNGIFSFKQVRTFRKSLLNESDIPELAEKEEKDEKDKKDPMCMNFFKKGLNMIIEEQKKEEEDKNSKRQELLLSIFNKKDKKITTILRSKLRDYNVRAKIESLAEYNVKPKAKKNKKKKATKENGETTEKKEKKDGNQNVDENQNKENAKK